MLIGESPGAEEEKLGVPFRGEVGELLNKMLIASILRDKIFTLVMQSILDHLMTENQPQLKLKDTQYF